MPRKPADPDRWQPCPPGELVGLAGRLKAKRRRRVIEAALATSLAALLMVWAGVYFGVQRSPQPTDFEFGGIACSEVRPIVAKYMSGELDPALAARVREHLAHCAACGRLMEGVQKSVSAPSLPPRLAERPGVAAVIGSRPLISLRAVALWALFSDAAADDAEISPAGWLAAFADQWDDQRWLSKPSGYMRPLDDEGWRARMRAFQALVKAGSGSVDPLLQTLREGTTTQRILAAQVLGYLGQDVPRQALIEVARADSDPAVRLYAIASLGMLGAAEQAALLQELAESESNRDAKKHIAYAVGRNGRPLDAMVTAKLAGWDLGRLDTAKLGQAAPDFELTSLSGETVRLSQFRGQKAVVLVFVYGDT